MNHAEVTEDVNIRTTDSIILFSGLFLYIILKCSIIYKKGLNMENEVKGVCYICGEPLVWDEKDEECFLNDYLDEEGTVVKEIRCKHCGTLYEAYITKDNDKDVEEDYVSCGDQGFGNCIHCGGTLVWSGDFMRSDYYDDPISGESLSEEDDSIVRSIVCGHCGCPHHVWEPSPNEINSGKYPYWNKEKNE